MTNFNIETWTLVTDQVPVDMGTVRDDKPSAHDMLSYLSLYKIHFEKSSFKRNLNEMLSFEHMNLGKFHLFLKSILMFVRLCYRIQKP